MCFMERGIGCLRATRPAGPAAGAALVVLALSSLCFAGQVQTTIESANASVTKTWVDPDTQHRIVRLSDEPNSKGLYFNRNAYTPDQKQMVYWAPSGIFAVSLQSFATRQIVSGSVHSIVVGTTAPTVYFMRRGDQHLYVANVNTGYVLQLFELPGYGTGLYSVNADETLLAGTYQDEPGASLFELIQKEAPELLPGGALSGRLSGEEWHLANVKKSSISDQFLRTRKPEFIFTVNLQTGDIKTVLKSTGWINHVLFSPTDPTLLMYCYEGRSSDIQRIWTVRTDGSQNMLVRRTAPGEYVTHEVWSSDGKTIWYESGKNEEKRKGEQIDSAYLEGTEIESGRRRQHHLAQGQISRHYNATADGKLFLGEGTGHPARSRISILHPQLDTPVSAGAVQPGRFVSEGLVNMSKQDYRLEPNARFSPDGKWVIFTSNMLGPSYVFAAEVARATEPTGQ